MKKWFKGKTRQVYFTLAQFIQVKIAEQTKALYTLDDFKPDSGPDLHTGKRH